MKATQFQFVFRSLNIGFITGIFLVTVSGTTWGIPSQITPGYSYFSNEYHENGGCYDLGEEKNLEEVYKNFNYYEAMYNALQQVVLFKAYKQEKLEWKMTCDYRDGHLSRTVTERPGQPAEIKSY
ncbi:MAG: hypothetical protein HQM12_07950 [SAR324 cluster bacterium]|nr:hypothetical protein [SAR324 cluster bacterium]